jgi:hypothetical protein
MHWFPFVDRAIIHDAKLDPSLEIAALSAGISGWLLFLLDAFAGKKLMFFKKHPFVHVSFLCAYRDVLADLHLRLPRSIMWINPGEVITSNNQIQERQHNFRGLVLLNNGLLHYAVSFWRTISRQVRWLQLAFGEAPEQKLTVYSETGIFRRYLVILSLLAHEG